MDNHKLDFVSKEITAENCIKFLNSIGVKIVKIRTIGMISLLISLILLSSPLQARDGDAIRFGGNIVIQEDETVESVVVVGGSVTVYGKVEESVVAIGGSIRVKDGGYIYEDAVSIGGKVEVDEDGKIWGSIVDIGNLAGLSVLSDDFHTSHEYHFDGVPNSIKILPFIGFLIIGLIVVSIFPGSVTRTLATIDEKTLPSLGFGMVGLLAFVPLVITLVITLLGIPLIPLFMVLFVISLFFGYLVAATWLGKKLIVMAKQDINHLAVLLITGLIAIKVVSMVPGIGGLVKFLILILGLGATLITLRNKYSNKPKVKELATQEVNDQKS